MDITLPAFSFLCFVLALVVSEYRRVISNRVIHRLKPEWPEEVGRVQGIGYSQKQIRYVYEYVASEEVDLRGLRQAMKLWWVRFFLLLWMIGLILQTVLVVMEIPK